MCSSSFASSKSRTMKRSSTSDESPVTVTGWTYPSRPSVVSGDSASAGELRDDVGRELDRVHELALGPARVDRAAADLHPHLRARERLGLHLAGRRAVDGVRGDRAELVDREVDDAAADLLVGVEHDLDRAVRDLGMGDEIGDGGEDLGDAGLVVGAEERRPVGDDELVAGVVRELGRLARADDLPRAAELDLAARVRDALRVRLAARLARRVDVREERDRRDVVVDGRGQRRGDVAVAVDRGVGEPELFELVAEEAEQDELAVGARVRLRVLVGLRVDLRVADEAARPRPPRVAPRAPFPRRSPSPRAYLGAERTPRRSVPAMRLRLVQLYAGLILYGISSSLLVLAGLGLDPWDVFHQGLSRTFGLSIGTWAIIVGVVVLLFWIPLRQRPGLGTMSNVVLVGLTMNVVLGAVGPPHALAARIACLAVGIVLNGVATGAYIGAGFGPGPRDGLMTGLAARGYSIRLVRTGLEVTVLAVGWLLGGTVGIGTLAYALAIGPLAHVFIPLLSHGRRAPAGALEGM